MVLFSEMREDKHRRQDSRPPSSWHSRPQRVQSMSPGPAPAPLQCPSLAGGRAAVPPSAGSRYFWPFLFLSPPRYFNERSGAASPVTALNWEPQLRGVLCQHPARSRRCQTLSVGAPQTQPRS